MFKGSNVALVTPFKNNKLDEENYIYSENFNYFNRHKFINESSNYVISIYV